MISRSRDAQIGWGGGGKGERSEHEFFRARNESPPGIEAEVLLALRRGLT